MRDCYRPPFHNLLAEKGDYTAVAAQHIAETGGYKRGFTNYISFLDSTPEALYVHLCQSFGSTHHTAGIYSFVCGDHDEFLYAIFQCRICHDACTQDIGTYRLAWIFSIMGTCLYAAA